MLCGWRVRQAWCNLQVKLCDPCLSALEVVTTLLYTKLKSTYTLLYCSNKKSAMTTGTRYEPAARVLAWHAGSIPVRLLAGLRALPGHRWWPQRCSQSSSEKPSIQVCRTDRTSLDGCHTCDFVAQLLSRNFIARQSCSVQLCMSRALHATLSHWPVGVQRQSCKEQSTVLFEKKSCATVIELRDALIHTCDFVAR